MSEEMRLEDVTLESMRDDDVADYSDGVNEGGQPPMQAEERNAAEAVTPQAQAVSEESKEVAEPEAQPAIQNTQPAPNIDSAMQFAAMRDENARLAALNQQQAQRIAQMEQQALATQQQNAMAANTAVSQIADNGGIPELNMDELLYASDEERARMIAEHNNALISYAAKQATADVLGKIQPLMQQYDLSVEESKINTAMDELSAIEGFGDVKEHSDTIKSISKNPDLAGLPPFKRMTLAALIDKGMRASQPAPAAPIPDINAQADAILANPELMKIITMRSAKEVQEKNVNIPTHTAGGGFGNAAYRVPDRPARMEDVSLD